MENRVRTILEIRECTISEVTTRNKSTNWKRMDQRVCGATTSNRTRRNRVKFRVTFHPRRVSISLCKYSTVMIDVETDRGRLFRGPYHYILPILILKSGCNGRGQKMIRFDALIQQSIPVFARSYTSPLLRRVAAFRWTDSAHRSRKYFALFARLLILARRYATVARPRDFLSRENHSRVGGESAVLLALRSGFRKDGRVRGISTCEISFFFLRGKRF